MPLRHLVLELMVITTRESIAGPTRGHLTRSSLKHGIVV